MNNAYLNKRKASSIEMGMIILLSMTFILPSISVNINFILLLGAMFLYLFYVFMKDTKTIRNFVGILIAVFLVAFFYTLLTDTKTISASASYGEIKQFASKFSQYLLMYLPVVFYYRMHATANIKQKKMLLLVISILIMYVVFQTLQELVINPNAVRQWEQFSELEDDNIGNYYFVYAIPVIITTIAVCMAKMTKFNKILATALIVFLFYFLIRAQYTLALLIAIIGVIICIFMSIKNGVFKAVFLIFAITFSVFIPQLLLFLSNTISSDQIALRLRELYEFFNAGNAQGYNLNGRLTLYGKTISAFFKSPIWGHRSLDFDGHATYLTILSDTGLLGAIPFYYLVINSKKKIYANLGEFAKKFTPMFTCLLCMGFTNPVHNSKPLSIAVWFIAPLAIDIFFNKEEAF